VDVLVWRLSAASGDADVAQGAGQVNRAMIAVIAAAVLFAEHAASQDQRPTFRATADLVAVEVSVRERTSVVTGLKASDFELLDNGVKQEVFDLSYGKLPIDVTVALDVSYSVTGDLLDRLRRGVRALMSDLGPADRLRLVLFNMQVRRVVDFGADVATIDSAIRTATAGGGTSIFDAISVELVSAEHTDRRQLVVVFTDGSDALSTTEPQVLLDVAARSNASVTMVMPGGLPAIQTLQSGGRTVVIPSGRPAPRRHAQLYHQLTSDTGGVIIPIVQSDQNLEPAFRRALEEFRSSYVLHFAPRGVQPDGFHTLQVNVLKKGNLTVRARRGYWSE
jgi:VWFA-related protein